MKELIQLSLFTRMLLGLMMLTKTLGLTESLINLTTLALTVSFVQHSQTKTLLKEILLVIISIYI